MPSQKPVDPPKEKKPPKWKRKAYEVGVIHENEKDYELTME
jgi:hypothetical protein